MSTTASSPRRLLLCLLAVATLTTAAFAATASAAAIRQPFYHQETTAGPADPQPCTGVSGTSTDTDTKQGYEVLNAAGTLHIFGTETQNIREDWIDGTYLIAQVVGPLSFNVNAAGTNPVSGTERFRGILYSPIGQILGYLDINGEFHYTIVDGTFVSTSFQLRIISSPC